jgi:SAM-dependent methyltransferase
MGHSLLRRLTEGRASFHGRIWNRYVRHALAADPGTRPGDEWGSAAVWGWRFGALFEPAGVAEWRTALEIGPGTGKYTRLVLERSPALVHCLDVSRAFLGLLEQELAAFVAAGRVRPALLGGERPDEVLAYCETQGLRRRLDAVFSVDAMVHVDLQYLVAYLVTAALCLREGGALVMTLADPTTTRGFEKLLDDVRRYYPKQGRPTPKFEWVSRDIAVAVLERLGFRILRCDTPAPPGGAARDLFVVATLAAPATADIHERVLRASTSEP